MSRDVGNSLIFNAARKPGETKIIDFVAIFNEKPTMTVCVCATIDEDGTPHTAPVNLIVAKDDRTLLIGLLEGNVTTMNIRRSAFACLEAFGPDDLAVGIKGNVRIVKEPMDCNSSMIVGEMTVEAVKQDTSPAQVVTAGTSAQPRSDRGRAFAESAIEELRKIAGV
ncbi:MAG: pyridoxamine 5'-phosphate oxidase family protein [Dehalococcoidia bacterium]|nr:pyridoxamine 5'-phosphate oxidase family protein [Dehalococcoidia bacterium]